MDRKLLPYEYQLIEALGVTKEEYLRFIAIQRTYADSKVGTALDVRNTVAGEVALALTIIGTLFQVGAALLAPKPQLPDQGGQQRQPRNKRLAPRFGFNSSLELASYGDPVSLVYTNTSMNGAGGVRVNGSLVWSAVETLGGNHFAQLLVVLGAGNIRKIDADRTALGQLPLSSYQKARRFLFFNNTSSGLLTYGDSTEGFNNIKESHPVLQNRSVGTEKAINLINSQGNMINGYSQTFSPSSFSKFGAYDPIPINVQVISRNSKGIEKAANGTDDKILIGNSDTGGYGNIAAADNTFNLKIPNISLQETEPHEVLADEIKQTAADSLDMSASYMLGTAKYRLKSVDGNPLDISEAGVTATFECIESGKRPTTEYSLTKPYSFAEFTDSVRDNINDVIEDLSDENSGKNSISKSIKLSLSKTLANALKDQFGSDAIKTVDFGDEAIELDWTQRIINHKDTELLASLNEIQRAGTLTADNLKTAFDADKSASGFNALKIYTNVNKTKNNFLDKNGEVSKLVRQGSIGHTIRQGRNVRKLEMETSLTKDAIHKIKRRINKAIVQINNGDFDNIVDVAQGSPAKDMTWEQYVTGDVDDEEKVLRQGRYKEGTKTYQDFSDRIQTLEDKLEDLITGAKPGEAKVIELNSRKNDGDNDNVFSTGRRDRGKNIVLTMRGSKKLGQFLENGGHISDWNYAGVNARSKTETQRETAKALRDTADVSPAGTEKRLSNVQRKITNQKRKQENFLKRGLAYIREWHIDRLENGRKEGEKRNPNQPMLFSGPGSEGGVKKLNRKYPFSLAEADVFLDHMRENSTEDLDGGLVIDNALDALEAEKRETVEQLNYLISNWERLAKDIDPKTSDNNFFTKCLSKIEVGLYSTVSSCDFVGFSLKTAIFRKISGRQGKYGSDKVKEVKGSEIKKPHTDSDNGIKHRIAFFKVGCRPVSTVSDVAFEYAPVIFAIRRATSAAQYAHLTFKANSTAKYEFKFEPVVDFAAEIADSGQTHIGYIENEMEGTPSKPLTTPATVSAGFFFWHGREYRTTPNGLAKGLRETRPLLTNEWDMFSARGDTRIDFSFENGPEFEIVSVTEQQKEGNNKKFNDLYGDLSMMGVHLYAGRNVQDIRSVSAFVMKGKNCHQINDNGTITVNQNSSSYAPDIFLDTILDQKNGVARYLPTSPADAESLLNAKQFCKNNGLDGGTTLFMDGVIAEASSWREFWIENAPFSLLELARKNGKDTLVPALPVNKDGRAANRDGTPVELKINALFTPGNILEGSYKEEFLDYGVGTQDLAVTVLYRETGENSIFSSTRAVNVKLSDALDEVDIVRQTVDASQFVTQRSQAILIGKLLCNQRRHIRRGIEFQTFPSEAAIEPGSFIYVDIGLEEWDKYTTGSVLANSVLNFPLNVEPKNDTYTILLYKSETGQTATESKAVTTSNGVTTAVGLDSKYEGYVFVMGKAKPSKRVFRVTEVALEEGGEVSVKAIEYPCSEANGVLTALIADFRDTHFTIS
nr:hypothetical protein [uncultured Mediterranean phage uvMED]